jgi:hypothetical protein
MLAGPAVPTAILAAVVTAVLTAGCGGAASTRQASRASAPPARPPATIPLVEPSVVPADTQSSGLPAPAGSLGPQAPAPVRLRIPPIGVDSPLLLLDERADGTLEVPSDFNKPGWYTRGPAPGEPGPAVILGHLDSYTGPAVFWRLSSLHKGDPVEVQREDGSRVGFQVTRVATFATDSFPTDEVYGATSGPELRLITCGGTFSLARRQYLENVVVFASLTQ